MLKYIAKKKKLFSLARNENRNYTANAFQCPKSSIQEHVHLNLHPSSQQIYFIKSLISEHA